MRRPFLLAALVTTVVATPVIAQSKAGFGPVVGVNVTTGSLGDFYGVGWLAGLQFVKATGFGSVMLEATYNSFSISDEAPEVGEDYSNSLNVWGFGAGPRFALGPFHVGALAAYYTEVDQFDVVPLALFNIWKLDMGLRYKGLLGDADWLGVTVSFHFGNW